MGAAEDELLLESPHSEETEVDSSPSKPPQLKPGDSFGSTFYGELNEFSLDSQECEQLEAETDTEVVVSQDGVVEPDAAPKAEEPTEKPFLLTYKRKPLPPPVPPNEIPKQIPPSHFSYRHYQGPDGEDVTVHYCVTLEQSEKAAQMFLNEPVVGLDMEWYPFAGDDIKTNASVVQLACQDKIAILHLALHEGTTVEKILPPSLKTLVESPDILKPGVNIQTADGGKLRDYLKLQPKGLFELSHLYNLIANKRTAAGYVARSLKRLADQVEQKLGLPLRKDSVRMSNWHKPLNQNQIEYAATDAYAGFMLYHVMNEARKLMKPTPPRPEFAELGLPVVGIPEEKEGDAEDEPEESKTRKKAEGDPADELQGSSLLLYEALCLKRLELANSKGMKPYYVASNQAMKRVALARPQTFEELQAVKGVGEVGIRLFGNTCLDTIQKFIESGQGDNIPEDIIVTPEQPITSKTAQKRQQKNTTGVEDSCVPLYNALCEKRRQIAEEKKLPSWQYYKIANNRVLQNIANKGPTSIAELREISGIGDWSIRVYGETWLSVVREVGTLESSQEMASENETSEDEYLDISIDSLPPGAEGCISGERVVFTGILDQLGRTGAQDVAAACGAEVLQTPDNRTTFVVTGRDVSEGKLQAIAEHNLQTVSEEEFLALIGRKSAEAQAQRATSPLPPLSALVGNGSASSSQPAAVAEQDRPFFNALRALRTVLSNLSKLPPDTICSDSTLRAIVARSPRSRADLVLVPGARALVDTAQRYGKDIDDFLTKHNKPVSVRREPSHNSVSDGSEEEGGFETATRPAPKTATEKWVYGEFLPPPPPAVSRKRKF